MREDFAYVDKATDLCLTTTLEGSFHIATLTEEESRSPEQEELYDLLEAIENEYFIVRSGRSLYWWYLDYIHEYFQQFAVDAPTSREVYMKAWQDGLITVRLVIWD